MLRRCTALVSRLPGRSMQSLRLSSQSLNRQQQDIQELNDFYPAIVEAVEKATQPCQLPTSESEWLLKVLEYNARSVRFPGCLSTLNAMRELSSKPRNEMDPDHMRKAKYLAWCQELILAAFNITDDLIDGGKVRWDKPCWYSLPNVGLASCNDAFILEQTAFFILHQQFKGSPCYAELMDLFTTTSFLVMMGQNLDSRCLSNGQAVIDDFNMQRYLHVVRLKTTSITFHTPVLAALIASGVQNSEPYDIARDISSDFGILIQTQDDYNDCFGEDEQDQVCNDIRNGTGCWMIVQAKKRANVKQMKILQENYGRDNQESIDAVKEVYLQLHLREVLVDFHQKIVETIQAKIEHNAEKLPPAVFNYVLETMTQNSIDWCRRNPTL